ncbi:MAG: ABC transporter permease [Thermoanaerobaculia bacterium]
MRARTSLAVAVGTLAAATLLVLLAGASPVEAFAALVRGAFGSRAALGETLARSTGLVLTAVGAVVAFRAGVLNIGLEGQFLAGAAAAAAVGPLFPGLPYAARAAVLLAAPLAGALQAAPAAWLAERRQVPAVLSTILLNLVAAAGVTWLVRGPLRDPSGDYPQSRALAEGVALAPLVPGSRATAAVLVALALAAVAAFLLVRSPLGLALRAVGESPRAARAAGLPDVSLRTGAFLASGALAGLAGGLEVLALTGRLYDPFTAGVGYTGIAAALLGGMTPVGAAASGAFFAALGAGSSALQRDAGVPSALASIVPALAVLGLLLARGRGGDAA